MAKKGVPNPKRIHPEFSDEIIIDRPDWHEPAQDFYRRVAKKIQETQGEIVAMTVQPCQFRLYIRNS